MKKLHSVTVRIDDELQSQIDAYVVERELEARIPLSRAHAVREILRRFFAPRTPSNARANTVSEAGSPRNQ